jgi:hypothetical protein
MQVDLLFCYVSVLPPQEVAKIAVQVQSLLQQNGENYDAQVFTAGTRNYVIYGRNTRQGVGSQ